MTKTAKEGGTPKSGIPFGVLDEQGVVELCEFCPDPDGSGLLWGKPTGSTTALNGRTFLGNAKKDYHGKCYDTGKFYSHAGEFLYELISVAPEGTALVVAEHEWAAGTKTFEETVRVKYYSDEKPVAAIA